MQHNLLLKTIVKKRASFLSSSETDMQKINLTKNMWVGRYMGRGFKKNFSHVTHSEAIAELCLYFLVSCFCLEQIKT